MDSGDVISDLIDIVLGSESPRVKQSETRPSVATSSVTYFHQLYQLIVFLIRSTYTQTMDFDQRLPSHITFEKLEDYEQYKTYFLSEEAQNFVMNTNFINKMLYD